ncbi:LuxR C-terminal-related transcriptional regulator [Microbacterium sp. NPDC078428]|uniref:LuxR C-terminal-related transcriptional regulator n=1 Tax=Microbacterium sp. NPDC078428 TaxID=3364190 RepID=UPI0037CB2786
MTTPSKSPPIPHDDDAAGGAVPALAPSSPRPGAALALYYGTDPHRLRASLARSVPTDALGRSTRHVLLALTGVPDPGDTDGILPRDEKIACAVRERARGRPGKALEILREHVAVQRASATVDDSDGWHPFLALLRGSTAMFAGDLVDAQAHLTRARMWHVAPELRIIHRHAHALSALLHAVVGNRAVALGELKSLDQVPVTGSWVEAEIAAAKSLCLSALEAGDIDRRTSPSMPLSDLRELWPFAAVVYTQPHLEQGHFVDVEATLESIERAGWPGVDTSDGLPGSVVPLLRAGIARARGDLLGAARALGRADPRCWETRSARTLLLLDTGELGRARDSAEELLRRATGMRRMRLTALGILAACALRTKDSDAADHHLGALCSQSMPLSPSECGLLPADVAAALDDRASSPTVESPGESNPGAVTPGERALLTLLETGATRAEIAAALFVSVNTVKTRLRLLYRKLGASSAAEALAHAHRRGDL